VDFGGNSYKVDKYNETSFLLILSGLKNCIRNKYIGTLNLVFTGQTIGAKVYSQAAACFKKQLIGIIIS